MLKNKAIARSSVDSMASAAMRIAGAVQPVATAQALAQWSLFIGIYRGVDERLVNFQSYVREDPVFVPRIEQIFNRQSALELVRVHRAPEQWHADMRRLLIYNIGYRIMQLEQTYLGHITLMTSKEGGRKIAETWDYYPKGGFQDEVIESEATRIVPGLGYATEWLVLSSLRGQITHVSTVRNPTSEWYTSKARRRQLERAGLPVREDVPIEEWLRGMLRGYRQSRRKHLEGSE